MTPSIFGLSGHALTADERAFFLYDLAAAFHAFWNMGNDDPAKRIIVTQDPALSGARLFLAEQIGQVVRNGLAILGVVAVEEL